MSNETLDIRIVDENDMLIDTIRLPIESLEPMQIITATRGGSDFQDFEIDWITGRIGYDL